jgi:hypothetical protein
MLAELIRVIKVLALRLHFGSSCESRLEGRVDRFKRGRL